MLVGCVGGKKQPRRGWRNILTTHSKSWNFLLLVYTVSLIFESSFCPRSLGTVSFLKNASFHRLFRKGESDYLYDNLGYRSLSQTKRKICIFLFIFEERICRVEIHMLFEIGLSK